LLGHQDIQITVPFLIVQPYFLTDYVEIFIDQRFNSGELKSLDIFGISPSALIALITE